MMQDHLGGLDPVTVQYALPVLTLALMQNFQPGEQAQLAADLANVRGDDKLSAEAKMRAVTVQLAKYLGSDLVVHAKAAALDAAGGGTVLEVEHQDGDGNGAYEVEVRRTDGSTVEIHLDAQFRKVGSVSDDDSGAESENDANDD